MTHNPFYEKLVDKSGNAVQGYIAYGLYKSAKRQWIAQFVATKNRPPKPAEVAAFVSAYDTAQTVDALKAQAAGILAQFADGAVADARPGIVEDALRGSFWGSVGQSIAANVIYTLALVLLVVILAFAGVDVLGIIEKIQGHAH